MSDVESDVEVEVEDEEFTTMDEESDDEEDSGELCPTSDDEEEDITISTFKTKKPNNARSKVKKSIDIIRSNANVRLGILSKYMKPKNVKIFEKAIAHASKGDLDSYLEILYDCVGFLSEGCDLATCYKSLVRYETGWNNSSVSSYREEQEKIDEITFNPPTIEEGVSECRKCKSKRTFSMQMQTRSGDESMTTFYTCAQCGARWKTG